MRKTIITLAALLLAGGASAQTQNVNIDTTPNTQLLDGQVSLPADCEYRGLITRGSPYAPFGGGYRRALRKLEKAVREANANVLIVTLINLNSGVPTAGNGYYCPALSAVTPAINVVLFPED